MTRIIAVAVPKGGTGKTTTVRNLGAALAEKRCRVLQIDLDPQGNLTQTFGLRLADLQHTSYTTIHDFLVSFQPQLDRAIYRVGDMDLVPTSPRLNLANDELAMALEREKVLKKLLLPLEERYDYILIDTLPYQGILTLNALIAATDVIIPMQTEYLASESVALILEQIALIRRQGINKDLSVGGILLTMADPRTNLHREAIRYARETLGQEVHVFTAIIKREIAFAESQMLHQSILEYKPHSDGAQAYRHLAQELIHGQV